MVSVTPRSVVSLKCFCATFMVNSWFSLLSFSIEKGSVIHTSPFKCCLIPNFISDEEFLEALAKELIQLSFFQKSNDLYKFHQVSW